MYRMYLCRRAHGCAGATSREILTRFATKVAPTLLDRRNWEWSPRWAKIAPPEILISIKIFTRNCSEDSI